jgi:prepilin-type N-terminal cleavage/methylation domain-containing protein
MDLALKAKGFTLIECCIGLSLFALLLTFCLPYLSIMQQKNQFQVVQNEVKNAIRFAKIQARVSSHSVVLMPLRGTTDWSHGIRAAYSAQAHAPSLFEWHWVAPHVQVIWKGFQSSHYLRLSADLSQSAANGSFMITTPSQSSMELVVNRLGRVRSVMHVNKL